MTLPSHMVFKYQNMYLFIYLFAKKHHIMFFYGSLITIYIFHIRIGIRCLAFSGGQWIRSVNDQLRGFTVFVLCISSNHVLHLYQLSRKYLERFQSYGADLILI